MFIFSREKNQQIIVGPATVTVKEVRENEVELAIEGQDLEVLPKEEWEARQKQKERQEAKEVETG